MSYVMEPANAVSRSSETGSGPILQISCQCASHSHGFRLKQRYTKFNTKRRLKACDAPELARLAELAQRVNYGGNPEHKKNPGDFGLTPPADPRPGKSLCDGR